MMSSRLLELLLALALAPPSPALAPPLRVCADPDRRPYSHEDGSGFENRIAEVLAAELQRPLRYHWMAQRRGFTHKMTGEGQCDLWIGVPAGLGRVLTTRPYYRTSHATRADDAAPLRTFEFAIAVGVRRGDTELRDALQGALDRRRAEIDAILAQYGVPRTDTQGPR